MRHNPPLKENFPITESSSPKINLSLRRNELNTVKILQYDWFSHANSDIINHFTVTVRRTFYISKRNNLNDEYEKHCHGPSKPTAE